MDLEKIISSDINRKVLRFFNENPHCLDTSDGIVAWTGLSQQTIKEALKKLVNVKILIEHRTSSAQGYSYTNNKTVLNAIKCWFLKHDKR